MSVLNRRAPWVIVYLIELAQSAEVRVGRAVGAGVARHIDWRRVVLLEGAIASLDLAALQFDGEQSRRHTGRWVDCSMRALSKYWTSRLPFGASLYGSCCPSRAVASGPQKFGCAFSACCHIRLDQGRAIPARRLRPHRRYPDCHECYRNRTPHR